MTATSSEPRTARVATYTALVPETDARQVSVDVDVRPGIPSFTALNMADRLVREMRERVRAAVLNSGYEFPLRRITVNEGPAHLRGTGAPRVLAVAVGILAAVDQLDPQPIRWAVYGDLSLDGTMDLPYSVRSREASAHAALSVAQAARRDGHQLLVLPPAGVPAARLADGLTVVDADTLTEVAAALAA